MMGVLNVTPDSFSDGGLWLDPQRAVEHGLQMLEEGADLLDVGAESTRPGGGVYGGGAAYVPEGEELRRLMPVLEGLRRSTDAPLSVDTRRGSVARPALAAGADLINDTSLLRDDDLGRAAAEVGCALILMHSRGDLGSMQAEIRFRDVVGEVRDELRDAAKRAVALGVDRRQIIVDPGIGFGKTYHQNLQLIRHLPEVAGDMPVLLGTSRKSFLGAAAAAPGQPAAPPEGRLAGSLATVAWASTLGAEIVRVHDVEETVRFLRVWHAVEECSNREKGAA